MASRLSNIPFFRPSFRQDLTLQQNARYLVPAHVVYNAPLVTRPFIDAFYRQKRSDKFQINDFLIEGHQNSLKKTRTYFLPGFLNHSPDQGFSDTLAQFSEYGLAFIAVSEKKNYINHDKYTLIGGENSVYQPDWRRELATVIQRIYVDLCELEANGKKPEHLVIVGHSKGGLLAHSLKSLAKDPTNIKHFKGVGQLPKPVIEKVLQALQSATFVGIGTPFFGLEERTLKIAQRGRFNQLFHGSADYFTNGFLENLYRTLSLRPEESMDLVITTDPHNGEEKSFSDVLMAPGRFKGLSPNNVTLYAGDLMFDMGARFFIEGSGDALVQKMNRNFQGAYHHIHGYNHLSQVGNEAAIEVAHLIKEAYLNRK